MHTKPHYTKLNEASAEYSREHVKMFPGEKKTKERSVQCVRCGVRLVCSTYVRPAPRLALQLQGQPPLGEQLEEQLDRGVLQALVSVLQLGGTFKQRSRGSPGGHRLTQRAANRRRRTEQTNS